MVQLSSPVPSHVNFLMFLTYIIFLTIKLIQGGEMQRRTEFRNGGLPHCALVPLCRTRPQSATLWEGLPRFDSFLLGMILILDFSSQFASSILSPMTLSRFWVNASKNWRDFKCSIRFRTVLLTFASLHLTDCAMFSFRFELTYFCRSVFVQIMSRVHRPHLPHQYRPPEQIETLPPRCLDLSRACTSSFSSRFESESYLLSVNKFQYLSSSSVL